MQAVGVALEKAKALGLQAWIWDEWVYPSGAGGGLVTKNTEFKARKLHLAMDVILEPGQCLSVGAVDVNNKYNIPEGELRPLPFEAGGRIEYLAGKRRERFLLSNASERVRKLSGHDKACPFHHLRHAFSLGKWRVAFHRDRLRNG